MNPVVYQPVRHAFAERDVREPNKNANESVPVPDILPAPTTDLHESWTVSEQPTIKLRTLNYNIDMNIMRLEDGYAAESHPEWRMGVRSQRIIATLNNIIESKRPGIIHLQEGRKFTTTKGDDVDGVAPLKAALEEHGYKVGVANYNDAGGAAPFKYLTAWDPSVLTFEGGYMKYVTATPDQPTPRRPGVPESERAADEERIKKHNFGQFWERGVYIVRFAHKDFKEPVYAINVHLDLPTLHRLEASGLLVQWVREILDEEPDAKIVMSGDFNTFPEEGRGGEQQLAILNGEQILKEASGKLQYANKKEAHVTFVAFPYDFIGVDPKSTNIHGTELRDLIRKLQPEEQSDCLEKFDSMQNPFELPKFLLSLEKGCRKRMIGLIYEQCPASNGSQLDRSFYRGFDGASCKVLPAFQFGELPDGMIEDDQAVKEYVLAHHDDGPAFASDHQPMLTSLRTRRSIDKQ